MSDSILPVPEVRRLAARLASLESELETLKAGARATQLDHSTIHGGRLLIRDSGGTLRGWLGRSPDGTFGTGAINGDPPPRPNTPALVPSKGGLGVAWNGEFFTTRPNDFSHLVVYLSPVDGFIPSNLRGTLSRPGSLPVGPLPYVPHYAVFVAVNTSGVESVPSLQSSGATPERLFGSDLFPKTITNTEMDDDSVDTPQLRANSVIGLHIIAEALEAYHLKAGIVEADKLAAILVLASDIIAGNPNGARLVTNATGITQYTGDSLNTIAMRLGADPAGGNFLTIFDPNDPARAVASIGRDGTITASGFAVDGSASINGSDLNDLLNELPKGVVARTTTASNSPTVNNLAKAGWLESALSAWPSGTPSMGRRRR